MDPNLSTVVQLNGNGGTPVTITYIFIDDVSIIPIHPDPDSDPNSEPVPESEFIFMVPNVFTPNSDGINDYFTLWGKGISKLNFQIYNLWGQIVFTSNQLEPRWDGTYKGRDCTQGVYCWVATYKVQGGEQSHERGFLTLMR